MITAVLFIVVVVAVLIYALMYMFLMGSSPGDNPALDAFIQSTLSSKSDKNGFMKSVFTFGYMKASLRRFWAAHRVYFSMTVAEKGKTAPDALVVTIRGEEKSLRGEYIKKTSVPLILNMGSYT
jgi:hypothetical protein